MHAKPSFLHRLQTAKMASSRTSAQTYGPWVKRVLLERKMLDTRSQWRKRYCSAPPSDANCYYVDIGVLTAVK